MFAMAYFYNCCQHQQQYGRRVPFAMHMNSKAEVETEVEIETEAKCKQDPAMTIGYAIVCALNLNGDEANRCD